MIHGSTSVSHEFKEVCVKCLNSVHSLFLFIYSSTSWEYPGHHASNLILFYVAATVVYWPPTRPNMPFQRRLKCIFHWRGRAWLTIWDRVKIPRYTHRLMHRKRVTCELHDGYFHLMTIKHTIPKIEWAIELLYTSVRTGCQWVGEQMS